jgi:hypothetical protein
VNLTAFQVPQSLTALADLVETTLELQPDRQEPQIVVTVETVEVGLQLIKTSAVAREVRVL